MAVSERVGLVNYLATAIRRETADDRLDVSVH